MKKTYETPVLQTEPFDTDDIIAASAPVSPDLVGANWQVPGLTPDWN